jgi:UDP-N-acetylglucosamine:LPS N-acetylglucosamine transferase
MGEEKRIKVCFAASSGGHYEQLMMLKPLMDKYDSFVITEKTDYDSSCNGENTYYLKQVNRKERAFLLSLIENAFISLKIYLKERPDMIVCTGVLAMIPMCMIMKVFGKELIYIESFAKVTSATQTGKVLYKLADRFLVQWEPMKQIFRKATYVGGIY